MKKLFKSLFTCVVVVHATLGLSQEFLPLQAGQPLPRVNHELSARYINQAGWYPQSVSYAPDQSNLLVGACPYNPAEYNNPRYSPRCTLIRYSIDKAQWQALGEINKDKHYEDAAYTFDGQAIFAHEHGECDVVPFVAPTRKYCSRLVLLDLSGKKLKNLTLESHNTYLYPSLTRDGKKILYWGVSNQLLAGMGGGAWDVKELDIASQRTVQKTDYQAAFPKTTPRYMPDGKRLMLAAEEYPKRPNDEDFFVTEEKRGRFRTNYVGKFGRNMTVVVDSPKAPIKPYFPTLKKIERDGQTQWEPVSEHMWLIVRDISRDGTLAVFDDRGSATCFRFIEEPLRKDDCFTRKTHNSVSASISPDNRQVATVADDTKPSITTRLYLLNVTTGEAQLIPMDW
jgi:hypothetical protein